MKVEQRQHVVPALPNRPEEQAQRQANSGSPRQPAYSPFKPAQ